MDGNRDSDLRLDSILGGAVERLSLMQQEQLGEIGEARIHDVEATGLGDQKIEHLDLVHFSIRDMDKGGNIAPKVEQGMQFYHHLGGTKACPRKHRETQIDGMVSRA